MRLSTILVDGKERAALVLREGLLPISKINHYFKQSWPTDLFSIIATEGLEDLKLFIAEKGKHLIQEASADLLSFENVEYYPLYRHPSKIWGIGLNYVEHASDLNEIAPNTEPASFMKPDTTIIGHGQSIMIPVQSYRTTAEAELGIIIGKECKNIEPEDVPNVIAGFTTILDMTAEDILEKNPRYLTRSKSFDTFFSYGPEFVTTDEVEDVLQLQVSTVINGKIHRKNVVDHMTFKPWELVSFHSKVMKLKPGDILTGTPGAVPINEGDVVECHIDGFKSLVNPVRDSKVSGIVSVGKVSRI